MSDYWKKPEKHVAYNLDAFISIFIRADITYTEEKTFKIMGLTTAYDHENERFIEKTLFSSPCEEETIKVFEHIIYSASRKSK